MQEKKLFLLDAYALIYRSYYAFIKNPRINSKGVNTSAIFGFVNTLEDVLKKENPSHIAVGFDPSGPTFRHEAYELYKAQREETPEVIRQSVPIIKEIIKAYNIPIIEVPGFEADDVIGTLAKLAEKEGFDTYMMTPDKDYGQLVSENVFMYRPKYGDKEFEVMGVNEIKAKFLLRLKMVIPYSYASILLHETTEDPDTIRLTTPICIPEAFTEAENEYMKVADEDHLLWLLHSREPRLVRESDLLEDQQRLNSPLYVHCYRKYNIFDSMQYASVYQQELLGILTLFRTEKDGPFTNEDMFYLQAIGMHLNAVLYQITHSLPQTNDLKQTLARLKNTCHLTNRELQIAEQIYQYRNNDEIAGSLGIRENTLQKHLQNIFRKTNVTSRWELLRFRMQ